MHFDLPTLMIAGSFVAAICGIFLVFAWVQDRGSLAPLWWAGANLALATGVPLVASREAAFGFPSMVLGIFLLNLSPAMIWAAAVSCERRRPNLMFVGAGSVLWLAAFFLTIHASPRAQMALNLGLVSIYLFAAAAEFWAGRAKRVMARWPLIVLLVLHGIFFAVGALVAALGTLSTSGTSINSWFGLIHFEVLFFVVGTAIFTVAMIKEQSELEHMTAARIDPLTGVANRRAFMETAATMVTECLKTGSPLSVAVFDLDRFKEINDSLGHAAGDRVLEKFGEAARGILRGTDLIGRPGGEEFAVVFPGSNTGAAYVAAERIRVAFSAACAGLVGEGFRATVSAGVAAAHADTSLDAILVAADRALYEAKARGRDQVTVAERDRRPDSKQKPPTQAIAAA